MKEIILSLIQAAEDKKKANNIFPHHITGVEISQIIKVSLRELVDAGQVKAGALINDYYITVIEPPQ